MIMVSKVCSEQIGKFLHLGKSICLKCPLAIQEVVLVSKVQGWCSDRSQLVIRQSLRLCPYSWCQSLC